MAKKILNDFSFFDEPGDIIDRVTREHEILEKQNKDNIDNLLRLNIGEFEAKEIASIPRNNEIANINLDTVAEYYHKCLFNNKEAQEFLTDKGLKKLNNHSTFKIGYADGSLLNIIGKTQTKELIEAGILNEKGIEIFKGCITIPITDTSAGSAGSLRAGLSAGDNQVIGIHGIDINNKLPVKSVYVNEKNKGIFNLKASKVYDEIILTADVLDCLSLIELGINNVLSIQGVDSFTGNDLKTLYDNRVKTIALAFCDNFNGADILTDLLVTEGFKIKIIYPPKPQKDWNEALLNDVEAGAVKDLIDNTKILQSIEVKQDFKVKKEGLNHIFTIGNIKYILTGVKEIFVSDLKLSVKIEYEDDFDIDNLNLCSSSSRARFSSNLSRKFNIEPSRIQRDLLKILVYLEDQRSKLLGVKEDNKQELTEEEIKLGMGFLKSKDLFEQIVNDMTTLGYVGEDLNKQLLYLCASSRKLDDPISVLIISQSASGKSMLVDMVRKLIPAEDVIAITSLSDQALNYFHNLLHKFLMFGEAIHSEVIEHQIREMLSSKELTRLVAVKDDKTGKLTSKLIKKKVIVASVMSTTNHKINPENASRFFIINADESIEQTKRIHQSQKNKYSLAREYLKRDIMPEIIKKHHAAGRLLKKIVIVNPFGKYLRFPDVTMRTRRDHDRFIDLIASVCHQRQMQKELKIDGEIEYIECDLIDYIIAYNIMVNGALGSTMMELPESAVILYEAIRNMVKKFAKERNIKSTEVTFTQRELREHTGFGQSWIKQNLRILLEYEYILRLRGGDQRGARAFYKLKSDDSIKKLDLSIIPTPDEMRLVLIKVEGQRIMEENGK